MVARSGLQVDWIWPMKLLIGLSSACLCAGQPMLHSHLWMAPASMYSFPAELFPAPLQLPSYCLVPPASAALLRAAGSTEAQRRQLWACALGTACRARQGGRSGGWELQLGGSCPSAWSSNSSSWPHSTHLAA